MVAMSRGEKTQQVSGQSAGSGAAKTNPGVAKKASNKPVEVADKTLACRYELKYHLTESKAAAVAQFVRQYLPVDRYAKLQRGGGVSDCQSLFGFGEAQSVQREHRGAAEPFQAANSQLYGRTRLPVLFRDQKEDQYRHIEKPGEGYAQQHSASRGGVAFAAAEL